MEREIIKDLEKWKKSRRRKPLILTGVRQCGKTYIVKEFARRAFDDLAYLNFEEQQGLRGIYDYDLDVHRILRELSAAAAMKIVPGKTLVFFDEIQECPRAITALKYFCEEMPELHIVCAGSLLGVAVKSEGFSFPVGKVNRLQMGPMSFREFAAACGREDLVEILESWPVDRPIPDLYGVPMQQLLREFYIVGGMPEAVSTWVETRDFGEVDAVQQEILRDYADDFAKHAPIQEVPKIRWIWESIPVQLAKENNKFVFSHVRAGKRSAELEDALQWLVDAGLVTQVCMAEKPELPLSGAADRTYFKVYLSDIGLLRARSNVAPDTILEESPMFVRFKGAFAENYVLNELKAIGKEPYFWRSGNSAEVDFIYESSGEIVPVEVKAADNTQAKSYRLYCGRYQPAYGFKISGKNMAQNMCGETRTVSLPLYLVWNVEGYEGFESKQA